MRLMTLLLLGLPLLAAADAPQGLDKLAAYAGSWDTVIHHLATPYSQAGEEHHRLENDCWRSQGYFACDQILDGVSKALIVYRYDAAADTYSSYIIPAGGAPSVQPGTLRIAGNLWTFPWDYTDKGKTTQFHVLNTWSSPDSIEFRQEYSEDGVHWTLMAEGHTTRIKH